MTLTRIMIVLGGALTFMMTIVVLRAEATSLHYELSRYDARVDALNQELHERELELARLKNPARIRARIAELRLGEVEAPQKQKPQTQPAKAAGKTKKP